MAYSVMMVFGTRPEAIKMAPLARVLRTWPEVNLHICSTGQHREMLEQVLTAFGLSVDQDLKVMTQNQTLNGLARDLLDKLDQAYEQVKPDIVLVHGDTTTSFIASLAAFHRHIPIGHVEAGLRTGNLQQPWPEEANRRLTGVLADLHFTPTRDSDANLIREGVPPEHIEVTGNTVIDALLWMRDDLAKRQWQPAADSPLSKLRPEQRMVLITGHRRENFGPGFERICLALAQLAEGYPDVQFVYPVHLNPQVQKAVYSVLSNRDNIHLIAPQDYQHFVWLMNRAQVILTDSGGVQEEAPGIGQTSIGAAQGHRAARRAQGRHGQAGGYPDRTHRRGNQPAARRPGGLCTHGAGLHPVRRRPCQRTHRRTADTLVRGNGQPAR